MFTGVTIIFHTGSASFPLFKRGENNRYIGEKQGKFMNMSGVNVWFIVDGNGMRQLIL